LKAIIMAGGQGTRLKAVTGDMPKPLVAMLGRPMMEHIILLLKKNGYTDICVTVKYRAEDIMNYFGDGRSLGVSLQYRVEEDALGTAGGVKNCSDFYGDENFLVISGDAACDFDLSRLMQVHSSHSASATIALYRHPEPLRYGLAVTDDAGRIHSFIEKPHWNRVVSDLVNTGIYVLSPKLMELVPEKTEYDFGKDLFPKLLHEGHKLLGIIMDGYWCDVGTPASYYKCCADALEGKLRLDLPESFAVSLAESENDPPALGDACIDCNCKSRAELMGALSAAMLDMGADYSDGIRLKGSRYEMHISPLSRSSAIRISVSSEDTEFARELAVSAKELAEAFDL